MKKLLLALFFTLLPTSAFAANDFSQMSPTVKVVSYETLYTGQITSFGSGSGTVVTPDGRIVTNNHVIFYESENEPHDTFEICITFDLQDEPVCEYTARLIANNKDLDLAILQLNDTDVFGNPLPELNYLDYHGNASPKEQQRVQVYGYPGSGGESITLTQGQISGVETFNDAKYYKTDSDIDFGNSGGTVLDENGNYIGIPTFIRSLAETLGYFIDIRDAKPWIDEHINDAVPTNVDGEDRLKEELARLAKANDTLTYKQQTYPEYKIDLPDGWKFYNLSHDGFYAEEKKLSDSVSLNSFIQYYPFEVDAGYLDELDEQLARYKEQYPDYKKTKTTFAGETAYKITYTAYNARHTTIYIPYGYTLFALRYSIDLDEQDRQQEAIDAALDSFAFTGEPDDNPDLSSTLQFDEPPFEISMTGNFRIQKNPTNSPIHLLAEAVQKDNYKGSFQIYYRQTPKDERDLSGKERLDETIKSIGGSTKLVYKNDNVVLDGLEGYLYTIEFEGSKYQEIRKRLTIKLFDDDNEFTIQYDDLTENFDENLEAIRQILRSFDFGDDSLEQAGIYEFGTLGQTFSDIQFHRFANAIGSLAEKDIVSGYSDGSFRPEQKVTRAEALKIILESKNHLEQQRGLGKSIDFNRHEIRDADFYDVPRSAWFKKYVNYATEKNIVSGYNSNRFAPRQNVTLAEALKMAYEVYELPIWQGETNPWQKKYMDKAYELGLLPRGWDGPNMQLTRAELSYLINTLYEQAKQ